MGERAAEGDFWIETYAYENSTKAFAAHEQIRKAIVSGQIKAAWHHGPGEDGRFQVHIYGFTPLTEEAKDLAHTILNGTGDLKGERVSENQLTDKTLNFAKSRAKPYRPLS